MSDDKIYFPNEVIGLQFVQGLSLLAAWRNYRGLSQTDLAERVDISLRVSWWPWSNRTINSPTSNSYCWRMLSAFSTNI
ncbi:helix-turn-helix domain-containing protein [Aeromonas caviae]|uniref:helix-turn-helix domain-containing protein n=1 Tax=Aeromonas caviae TaxID=648 RepID=UPI00214F0436|nr:helix-turn-helix transcriptional regulator [Aeromonas caviae]MCR3985336.1 helix-turn-helix domain-containing protein [Aeromonas caviae]